jgi:hypothetical protein
MSMSGNPANAAVWSNADVYIGPLTATIPVDGEPFDSTWDLVGLLNGDDGFTEKMTHDSKDFYAWGGILVATTRKNFKLTRSFTAYEDNATVHGLWYAGSTLTYDGRRRLHRRRRVPGPEQAVPHRVRGPKSDGTVRRVFTKGGSNFAQVDERGDSKEGESDLAARAFTIAIYPDANGNLFHTWKGQMVAVTSIASAPTTVAKTVGQSQQLVITATLANTHAVDVTDYASYTSSNTAKATVSSSGLVTGVATGSATITIVYKGKTTTVAATIS